MSLKPFLNETARQSGLWGLDATACYLSGYTADLVSGVDGDQHRWP